MSMALALARSEIRPLAAAPWSTPAASFERGSTVSPGPTKVRSSDDPSTLERRTAECVGVGGSNAEGSAARRKSTAAAAAYVPSASVGGSGAGGAADGTTSTVTWGNSPAEPSRSSASIDSNSRSTCGGRRRLASVPSALVRILEARFVKRSKLGVGAASSAAASSSIRDAASGRWLMPPRLSDSSSAALMSVKACLPPPLLWVRPGAHRSGGDVTSDPLFVVGRSDDDVADVAENDLAWGATLAPRPPAMPRITGSCWSWRLEESGERRCPVLLETPTLRTASTVGST